MQAQIQSHDVCAVCKKANVLSHANLDLLLENDEEIEVVCFWCEHKWKLNAQDKVRIRNQRKELRKLAAGHT